MLNMLNWMRQAYKEMKIRNEMEYKAVMERIEELLPLVNDD